MSKKQFTANQRAGEKIGLDFLPVRERIERSGERKMRRRELEPRKAASIVGLFAGSKTK